jgi:hypothetical protein
MRDMSRHLKRAVAAALALGEPWLRRFVRTESRAIRQCNPVERVTRFGLGVGTAAGVVAAVAMAGVVASDATRLPDIAFEVGKAALGLVATVIVGGFLASELQRRDSRQQRDEQAREHEREQAIRETENARTRTKHDREYVVAFRREAIDAYNAGKSVRAHLRAAGLRQDARVPLTAESLATLDAQMSILVDVQLAFERLKREARDTGNPVRRDGRAKLEGLLEEIERDLRAVVRDWEDNRVDVHPGLPAAELARWTRYATFVATIEPSLRFQAEEQGVPLPIPTKSGFARLEDELLYIVAQLQA